MMGPFLKVVPLQARRAAFDTRVVASLGRINFDQYVALIPLTKLDTVEPPSRFPCPVAQVVTRCVYINTVSQMGISLVHYIIKDKSFPCRSIGIEDK